MDVSKLDQWEMIMEHADQLGMFLHFKTQEAENQGLLDEGEVVFDCDLRGLDHGRGYARG